jgi:hypothetical protein
MIFAPPPVLLIALLTTPVQDTARKAPSPDSYADPRTAELVTNARAARERNERLVTAYTAKVSQRIGVGIRALSRDRMLYRQELVANIEWKRDAQSKIEVVGAREGIPVVKRGDQVPEDLDDNVRSLVVNPAEDYLRVMGMDEDNDGFVYPLREGGERDYKFAAGDSTIITLPSGKKIRLTELKIIPRRSDWRLISGSLWFDADTYGLVRAVFRPARPFELQRDLEPEDKEDVPKWVNATGEVKYVTLEYGLYENRWWMLRYSAIDAVGSMGSWLGMPIRMERIYSDYEVEGGTPPDPNSKFRPAGTLRRRPDDSTLAGLDSVARKIRRDSIRKAVDACVDAATDSSNMRTRAGRQEFRVRMRRCTAYRRDEDESLAIVLPEDTLTLVTNPSLGEPILQMGDLITESELKGLAQSIQGLPKRPWETRVELPRGVMSLLSRARYNRVEALSLGVGGKADFGRLVVDGQARIGLADWWPNAEVGVSVPGGAITARLAGYRRLTAANPETRPFGVVNSVWGFLAHRDDGEYFRAGGAELVLRNPGSGWWSLRAYAEHQTSAKVETDFSLPHLFGSDAVFQPNILADRADQQGLVLTLRGDKPLSRSLVLSGETMLEGATGDFQFGRGQATVRGLLTPGGPIAVAVAASAGTSRGTLPVQSLFFLGGPATLRGYDGGVLAGEAFWTGRAEVANSFPAARVSLFSDIGWAGPRTAFGTGKPLISAGVGASMLDGLIRMDLARGLRGPKGWRFDLYFDGVL